MALARPPAVDAFPGGTNYLQDLLLPMNPSGMASRYAADGAASVDQDSILNGEFDFLTRIHVCAFGFLVSRDTGANCVPEKHRPAAASGRSHCGCRESPPSVREAMAGGAVRHLDRPQQINVRAGSGERTAGPLIQINSPPSDVQLQWRASTQGLGSFQ